MGAVCTTGALVPPTAGKHFGGTKKALDPAAAARATMRAATAGWAEAAQLVKKQLAFGDGQVGFVVIGGITMSKSHDNRRHAQNR